MYQEKHAFVWKYGQELVGLLEPRPGERILDVGCGPGQLTAQIAAAGAEVTGIDSSAAMVAEARKNYPALHFEEVDASRMKYDREFHAVFSNAALHWIRDAGATASGMARALASFRVKIPESPWFYPGIGEYASMLERHGLEVNSAALFDRPTPLPGGLGDWIAMFGGRILAAVGAERREAFIRQVEENARPALWRDGEWLADYRRLRITAKKG